MIHLTKAIHLREPLLIQGETAQLLIKEAEGHLAAAGHKLDDDAKAGLFDRLAQVLGRRPGPTKVGSVGILSVTGVMGANLSPLDKALGGVDVFDLSEELAALEADPEVKTVLAKIDSPGGTVTGVPELAQQFASLSKPTVAFTDTKALSGGMWLASGADRLVATPSARLGSIGVYTMVADTSEMEKKAGVNVRVFSAGKYKTIGLGPLTKEQEDHLQAGVEAIHGQFKAFVSTKRIFAKESAMEGQVMPAAEAAKVGLATGIVPSFRSLVASLQS